MEEQKFSKRINSMVNKYLEEDGLLLLECWSRDGYTYKDIANCIGISVSVLSKWRNTYPEINKALRNGREIIDYKVENALLKSALGYETQESKITFELDNATKQLVCVKQEITTKEVLPNVMAIKTWLSNRLPEKWKNNRDNVIDIKDGDNTLQISVVSQKPNAFQAKKQEHAKDKTPLQSDKVIHITPTNTKKKSNSKGNSTIDEEDDWSDM